MGSGIFTGCVMGAVVLVLVLGRRCACRARWGRASSRGCRCSCRGRGACWRLWNGGRTRRRPAARWAWRSALPWEPSVGTPVPPSCHPQPPAAPSARGTSHAWTRLVPPPCPACMPHLASVTHCRLWGAGGSEVVEDDEVFILMAPQNAVGNCILEVRVIPRPSTLPGSREAPLGACALSPFLCQKHSVHSSSIDHCQPQEAGTVSMEARPGPVEAGTMEQHTVFIGARTTLAQEESCARSAWIWRVAVCPRVPLHDDRFVPCFICTSVLSFICTATLCSACSYTCAAPALSSGRCVQFLSGMQLPLDTCNPALDLPRCCEAAIPERMYRAPRNQGSRDSQARNAGSLVCEVCAPSSGGSRKRSMPRMSSSVTPSLEKRPPWHTNTLPLSTCARGRQQNTSANSSTIFSPNVMRGGSRGGHAAGTPVKEALLCLRGEGCACAHQGEGGQVGGRLKETKQHHCAVPRISTKEQAGQSVTNASPGARVCKGVSISKKLRY